MPEPRQVRQKVADVLEAAVAHGAAEVVALVHAVAVAVHVLARRAGVRAEEGAALEVGRGRDAGEAQHRGREVDKAHQAVRPRARLAGSEVAEPRREAHQERHAQARVVEPALRARHPGAVVGIEEHDGAVRQAVLLELAEDLSRLLVHPRDAIVVAGPVAAHLRGVRVVRRDRRLRGVVQLRGGEALDALEVLLLAQADLALVRDGEVEDGKERLRGIPALPPVRLVA
jgi:hypothetical protein